MSPFEIALIIIGIILVVTSCFFVEYQKEETIDTEIGNITEQILYSKISETNDKITQHVTQLGNELVEKTNDELNKVSNEKIMAVHEYTNQVITDIKKSHEEVLFLYQMLTQKESDVNDMLGKIQQMKNEVETAARHTANVMHDIKPVDALHQQENVNQYHTESISNSKEEHFTRALEEIENQEFANHIEEILALYEKGYSVVEISKRLELGQGEVQLVLDYNKR